MYMYYFISKNIPSVTIGRLGVPMVDSQIRGDVTICWRVSIS